MPAASARRVPAWLVPAAIVLVALVLLVVSVVGGDDEGAAQQPAATSPSDAPVADVVEPEQQTLEMARREEGDALAYGPVDAPVTLVVYNDFQCPFCAVWAKDTEPTMMEYADAGDLRIEWRDINAFGPVSVRAAQAAFAAGQQDAYVEYHHALFEDGEKRPADELTDEALIALAGELGLDVERFSADLDSPEVAAGVQANVDEAAAIGVYSTPAFLVGGTPILGAQPTEVFVQAYEEARAKAQG
jgi:protein-disulfide isomerase